MKENDEKILLALLNSATIAEAAEKSGVSERTVFRRLADKDFQSEWRSARRTAVETAVNQLQSGMSKAVKVLLQDLKDKNPAIRIRAAKLILEHSRLGLETFDFIARVEKLEAIMDSRENQ